MNTKANVARAIGSAPLQEFRSAIASVVLVRARAGVDIVAGGSTGARDPWIFDFRALMLQSAWLNRYAELFWQHYHQHYPFQVGSVETAGIALLAAIVMKGQERGTPVNGFYLRKSRKRTGLMKQIEGTLTDEPVIFVDDLMNSGQSINKQVDILHAAGKKVTDAFVILTFRENEAYAFLTEKNVRLTHLFSISDFGLPLQRSHTPEIPKDDFEVLWKYSAPAPLYDLVVQKSAPVLDEERIYFGCDDGAFRALSLTSGEVAWEFRIGKHPTGKSILSSPALHGELVYFGAYDGTVYALEAKTGKKIWSYADADWVGSSPDIAPDLGLIYIGLEYGLWRKHGGIAALDLRSGHLTWHASHPSLTHGSPLYIKEEGLVVIGSNDGVLYAYDAKSGELQWKFASRGDIKTRAAYDAKRRAVVFASMDGRLYALGAQGGMPLHARETGSGIYSIPLVHNDTLFIASLDKCLYAIDCTNWKDLWTYETGGRVFASPVFWNNSLWLGSNDGKLHEIDPRSGKLKRFFQTTERIVNAIAVKSDLLFVPTNAGEIYCLRSRTK